MMNCRAMILCILLTGLSRAGGVPLTCWILCSDDGNLSFDESRISNMVVRANQIYRQVGMSFEIVSMSKTNNSFLAELDYPDSFIEPTICGFSRGTGGLEVYFTYHFTGDAAAVQRPDGIIIGPRANENTLAHEIGHACGLKDVYVSHDGVVLTVDGLPSQSRIPDDWEWYHDGVSQADIVRRLVMYGEVNTNKGDLSYGDVYGLSYTSNFNRTTLQFDKIWHLGNAPVGFALHGNRHPVSE